MLVLMKYVEMNEYIQKKTAIRGDVSSSLSSIRKLTCVGLNFLDKVGFCQHQHSKEVLLHHCVVTSNQCEEILVRPASAQYR